MKSFSLALLAMTALSGASVADSVVLGRVASSKHADDVDVPCPEDAICLHSWWRWVINVNETLSGPKIHGRVVSARMQHTDMLRSAQRRQQLFVLKPIESDEQKNLLKADFYLEEMSAASKMYCLWTDPKQVGLDADAYASREGDDKRYCFELPEKQ